MWAPSVSLTARTMPRPRRPPSDSGGRHLAHAHDFAAAVSHPSFPPPRRHHPPPRAALRGAHRRRSSSFLSSSSVHASSFLLLTPCRRRLTCPATEAPPENTTSPLLGWPRFCSFLREKALRTTAAAAIPQPPDTSCHQASLVALPLRRHHPTTARAPATFLNRELLTTTTGRCPSLPFPFG
jgi:hypothetical protein